MPHLDEGLLMALLDGELTGSEQQEAERHLQSCAECSARLEELKGFMQEADGLVSDLGEPPELVPSVVPMADRRTPRRLEPRTLAWAASIVAALGLGFAGSQLLLHDKMPTNYAAGADQRDEASSPPATPTSPSAAPPEVALRQEQQPTESGVTGRLGPADERDRAGVGEQTTPQSNEALSLRSNIGEVAGEGAVTGRDSQLADVAATRRDSPVPAPTATTQASAKMAELAIREESQARDQRAAAASPANGAGFRARLQVAPVFQRVTMEQAVGYLSGAIRLIDGLTPEEFSVSGADSLRPLVRVLYRVGPAEARLLLEQSRVDNSFVASDLQRQAQAVTQGTSGNTLSWNDLRGFALTLTGPFSPDSLFHFKTLVK